MSSTKPITPQDFWSLFESWATTRVVGGVLWLPQGWSDWALQDFQAFVLGQSGGGASGGFDLATAGGLVPGEARDTLHLNRSHLDAPEVIVHLQAQSGFEGAATFTQKLARDVQRLGSGPMGGRSGAPIVLAVALGFGDAAARWTQEQGFRNRFSVPLAGSGTGAITAVQALSLQVARSRSAVPARPGEAQNPLQRVGVSTAAALPTSATPPVPPPPMTAATSSGVFQNLFPAQSTPVGDGQ